MDSIHENIRAARKAAKLTQHQVAKACGVTRNAVTQWESATKEGRTEPSIKSLLVISAMTGTSVSALLGQPDKPSDLSADESILINTLRQLPQKDAAKVYLYCDALSIQGEAEKLIPISINKSTA